MRIVFIGCVEFSYAMLEHLLAEPCSGEVVGVVSREASTFNSDFSSLQPLALAECIPYFEVKGNSQPELVEWLRGVAPDVIYCFGWSYLLKSEILEIPTLGVIGYHPAALPKNRGRHPIIWTLALGLSESASTFFFMDEGADSGDLLSQVVVPVEESDDAATLYSKLIDISKEQLIQFTEALACRDYKRVSQDENISNHWRKRSKDDGLIDWRMPARGIYNLIRALTRPYVGAHCIYRDEECKIWKSNVLDTKEEYINLEPGKVLHSEKGVITVKCGVGAIELIEHEMRPVPQVGEYL
jgi:methionyl-tRNA formyltransferase